MSGTSVSNSSTTTNGDKVTTSAHEFDPSLSEEERRFYTKAYPSIDLVKERKVHCTVCKSHIGTAPCQEAIIKMHPVLRVTHCTKCHEFYNSGEFSKGEDGSELYCRWCGQGGEVYCCSNCPYVFCKSCIVKNLSRGVVADIEQNENWSCFNCAPKILWPLRAQHWALVNFIEKQKKEIQGMNLSESERKQQLTKDRSLCCRVGKTKLSHKSDSLESLDSLASRRSHGSSSSHKRTQKHPHSNITQSPSLATGPPIKRAKNSNEELECTPDLLSMLEPDCQITMTYKSRPAASTASSSTSKEAGNEHVSAARSSTPPPLVLRNTSVQMRRVVPGQVMRRTFVGPCAPAPSSGVNTSSPVYHTINGFRIDLNSAAQQETFRLPNGKLIQVKRQASQLAPPPHSSPPPSSLPSSSQSGGNNWRYRIGQASPTLSPIPNYTSPLAISQSNHHSSVLRSMHSPGINNSSNTNGVRILNGTTVSSPGQSHAIAVATAAATATAATAANANSNNPSLARTQLIRHNFPDTAIGQARSQLQDQIFNAMEICQHLTGKLQTLTNSNAYKQARNYIDVKELYIHLSYLLTYGIGRFKGLQDKCLADMRQLGFVVDADSLENGQLAAGVDYVRYGQLDDVDLFNTGCNSFHNQVYEYRKSLHAKLDNDDQHSESDMAMAAVDPLSNTNNTAVDEESLIEPMDDETIEIDDNDDPEDVEPTDDGTSSIQNKTTDPQHSYDRKLTRLVERYPAIWCTRHPNYGNFDVTRRQWRIISSHFKRAENIKLRWKNIRKRYVRIERRTREGKRFTGHFDKATNFLANRNLPMNNWMEVDRGENTDDTYEGNTDSKQPKEESLPDCDDTMDETLRSQRQALAVKNLKPIEIRAVDMRIINFVKSNTILWQKSTDPNDEQMRKLLWMHLWKSMPNINCDDIIDRWKYLYEMYKTFRLKTIKNGHQLARLELKYSKYLAKLYFLYKIDEDVVRNESSVGDDCPDLDDQMRETGKLQTMSDDKEFVHQLVTTVKQYRSLWDKDHSEYYDTTVRERVWGEVAAKLINFKRDEKSIKLRWQLARFAYQRFRRSDHCKTSETTGFLNTIYKNLPTEEMSFLDIYKQASDDEDNEIEIVEPKTDTITLDSDNEDDQSATKCFSIRAVNQDPANIAITTVHSLHNSKNVTEDQNINSTKEFMSTTQSILASILDVDTQETPTSKNNCVPASTAKSFSNNSLKGGPRKKTTNKPNPKLLWQRKQYELHRMEDMKRLDKKRMYEKFRKKCIVKLRRVEFEYPKVKKLIDQSPKEVELSTNITNTENSSNRAVEDVTTVNYANTDQFTTVNVNSFSSTCNEIVIDSNDGCDISVTEKNNEKGTDIKCGADDTSLNISNSESEICRNTTEQEIATKEALIAQNTDNTNNVESILDELEPSISVTVVTEECTVEPIVDKERTVDADDKDKVDAHADADVDAVESANDDLNAVADPDPIQLQTVEIVKQTDNQGPTFIIPEQSIAENMTNSQKDEMSNDLNVAVEETETPSESQLSAIDENRHIYSLNDFEILNSQTEGTAREDQEKAFSSEIETIPGNSSIISNNHEENSCLALIQENNENLIETTLNKIDSKNVNVVDFDVTEEIEKLLQKVGDDSSGKIPSDIELNSVNVEITNVNNQKEIESPTISTLPDLLFNDINELIAEEANAMT